ncbi:hypothetical protein [Kordia jejudonensis]|uniref:hypothetical protein n=1 Tax=Kordia jejudonensis TaxID=1348245 RepID=UPI0006299048|nr:hypothetical protein [Kordia jejudonensis]
MIKLKFTASILVCLFSFTMANYNTTDSVILIGNIHLQKKDDGKFNLIFERGTSDQVIFKNVNSLCFQENLDFLIYCDNREGKKRWFYVYGDLAYMPRKVSGNWHDGEFRKYRLKEIYHEKLFKKLKSAEEVWKQYH